MSDIFEKRQAFNFYRSYYDTSLLLENEDRIEFLDSILHYQFTGQIKEPSKPMALLAFRGQIHSLKKQVIGFQRGKETYPNGNPTKGNDKGKHKGSHKEVQDKEEVQEEEKGKEEIIVPPTAKPKTFKQLSEEEFKHSLVEFVEGFGKKTVRAFFEYWSEKDGKDKMRFQLEKTWDSKRRLTTWKGNEPKFGTVESEKTKPQKTEVTYSGPFHN